MTDSNTPINQQAEVFDGNVVFDNVFILNNLDYDFSNDDLTTRNLRVTGIATFGTSSTVIDGATDTIQVGTALTIGHSQGLQFHTQNLHSTGFEVNQINVGGIATITSDLYLTGALVDSSGNTGSSGQLLASTGSGTDWINANSTSVLNAINVGVNLVSSGADHFVSFFEASSGNRPNRVGSQFTYNPATNTMSGINHAGTSTFNNVNTTGITTTDNLRVKGQLRDGDGNFGSAGQVLTSDGTDTKWDASSNLPAGSSAQIAITDVSSGTPRILLATGSGTQKDVLSNSSLTYNTSTQVIGGKISSISNHDTDDLSEGSSNLYHTTSRVRSSISASGDLSYNSSTGVMSFSAPSAFVQGMIILWYGNTNNIPSGFVLCDGSNSTPNLTDRFVVGAGAAYSPGATGGESTKLLGTANLPSHTHTSGTLSASNKSLTGDITKISECYNVAGGATGVFTKKGTGNSPVTGSSSNSPTAGVDFDGSHDHNISGNTGDQGGTMGQSFDIRPPYYALCYIMKT